VIKSKFINSRVGQVAALGVVGAIGVLYVKSQATKAAGVVGDAIDPTNQQNIINRGVSAVGATISGEENWTLGGWIYDITHKSEGP
jgi:hypothetical protein